MIASGLISLTRESSVSQKNRPDRRAAYQARRESAAQKSPIALPTKMIAL
jgi:hypothetical protein